MFDLRRNKHVSFTRRAPLHSTARVLWRREGGEVLVQDSVMLEKETKPLFPFGSCARQIHVAFLPEAGDSLLLGEGSGVSISSKFFVDLHV